MLLDAILYMLVGVIVFCLGGLAVYVLIRDKQYNKPITQVINIPKPKQEKEDKTVNRKQEEEDYNAFYQ